MGVWGAGIFQDDDALDVRADYRWYLADIQSDNIATDNIVKGYGATFEDLEANTSLWLALALTQWKMGRLDERVKASALRIVDEGMDLKKWEGSKLKSKRASALRQLRERIVSASPPACNMPKPLPVQLPGWEFGEIVGVRAVNGRLILLHMITYRRWTKLKVKAPGVTVLNWVRPETPTQEEIASLTYINWHKLGRFEIRGNYHYGLASPSRSPTPESKFIHTGLHKPVTRAEATSPYRGILYEAGETLDNVLEAILKPYWEDPTLSPHRLGFDGSNLEAARGTSKI